MTLILLTGAGFSRNWGGWLANEAFEYLIGIQDLSEEVRSRLWRSKLEDGGVEDTLAELQLEVSKGRNDLVKHVEILSTALHSMFNQMNSGFTLSDIEIGDGRIIPNFKETLKMFDAIFTLNQDLLIEMKYWGVDTHIHHQRTGKKGTYLPGTDLLYAGQNVSNPVAYRCQQRRPVKEPFSENFDLQPYYKLHGSCNWRNDDGKSLLIMGGNKAEEIQRHPLLRWYHENFVSYLRRPNARLMIIGYSFGDQHINKAIVEAVDSNLQIFIVDPLGVDALRRPTMTYLDKENDLIRSLKNNIVGASRRSLLSTFKDDRVEHGKFFRFLID